MEFYYSVSEWLHVSAVSGSTTTTASSGGDFEWVATRKRKTRKRENHRIMLLSEKCKNKKYFLYEMCERRAKVVIYFSSNPFSCWADVFFFFVCYLIFLVFLYFIVWFSCFASNPIYSYSYTGPKGTTRKLLSIVILISYFLLLLPKPWLEQCGDGSHEIFGPFYVCSLLYHFQLKIPLKNEMLPSPKKKTLNLQSRWKKREYQRAEQKTCIFHVH